MQTFQALFEKLKAQNTDDEFVEAKSCSTKLSESVWESADLDPVQDATFDDLDETYCDLMVARARQITPRAITSASTRTERLANLNIINREGKVTLAGLLCAGKYPQRFFPKLHIDVAVHPDNEKSAPGAPRFLDRSICEGTIVEMLDDAVLAVSKNIKRVSTVNGLERHDELEIPESVLREALANALVHREYGFNFQGQAVAVDIFPNRIEIISPGMLWGGKSVENLDNGESCCRNAALMKLLLFAPFSEGGGAAAEGNGSGIIQMKRTMLAKRLPEPEFIATFSSLKVIIWRTTPSGRNTNTGKAVSCGNAAGGAVKNAGSTQKERMAQESSTLLNLIKQNNEVGIAELKQLTGFTDSKIRARLNSLLSSNAIEPTASKTSRNRKYRAC
jgi:ATP-dependent DNA helicase RecG